MLGGLFVVLAACQPSASPTDSEPGSAAPSAAESMAPGESAPPSEAAGLALAVVETTAGPALAGEGGLTLYITTADASGVPTCVDTCAQNWPPLAAPIEAGDADPALLGTVTRPDGSEQVTYDGWPLYYFAGDAAEGDAAGEGLNGVWFIADPAGN
jgi:predicted lipoprotein with Yx(FWY)xxD motif